MSDELLPCPLCGGTKIKLVGSQRPYWLAKCEACGCSGGLCMTKDQAHTTWNTRANAVNIDKVREVIAELRNSRNYACLWSKELADKLTAALPESKP